YSLIWNDFCSWYLEWIKPQQGEAINKQVLEKTKEFFEKLLALLHPYMPFVTEEIFHQIKERKEGEDLIVYQTNISTQFEINILEQGETARQAITAIRNTRNKNGIEHKEGNIIHSHTEEKHSYQSFRDTLVNQINANSITVTD